MPTTMLDEQTIADAYIYLLGRALAIRQEQTDSKAPGFEYNAIKYNPLGSADFVNPNLDVAYLEAWIAVDDNTPAILEVPEIKDRYYTAQIMDEWAEVVVNINERTFPSKPFGKFALVKPGSAVQIPADAARVELHSSKAKMLARVELKGDPAGAVALQKQFKLHSAGSPKIQPPAPIPDFNNRDLMGSEIFENVDTILSSALDVAPVAAVMQQKARFIAASLASGTYDRAALDKLLHENVVPQFKAFAVTKSSPYLNHWLVTLGLGNYGANYPLRTTANYVGIWANTTDEVVYFVATRDVDEEPLDGGKSYVIHFPPDKLPGAVVNGYWSVILVGVPDYRVVPNPLNRFNLNTYSPLKTERDGSLKIAIGPKASADIPESNWLPSADGKPFSLTFRTYVPKDIVKRGEWTPPPLTLSQ